MRRSPTTDRRSPAASCGKCAARPPSPQSQARRIQDCDDPCRACPWPGAPGRVCWSVLESGGNAFQYARSSRVLPGTIVVSQRSISLFGEVVPCPAGAVNAQEDRHWLANAKPRTEGYRLRPFSMLISVLKQVG